MSVFHDQPEFITRDCRVTRPAHISYRVDADFMTARHEAMLPKSMIEGKTVLDLGCAVAATGAWALANGATHYTGIELQEEFADIAAANLSQYYSPEQWKVFCVPIETFLSVSVKRFDVIVISGVLYGIADYFSLLKQMTKIAGTIVIEGVLPNRLTLDDGTKLDPSMQVLMSKLPIVQYAPEIKHSDPSGVKSIKFQGTYTTPSAINAVMEHMGWLADRTPADLLAKSIPSLYDPEVVATQTADSPGDPLILNHMGARYAVWCRPADDAKRRMDFHECYALPKEDRTYVTWQA